MEYMMWDSPERDMCVIYLQLIRILSGTSTGGKDSTKYQSFYKKNNRREVSSNSSYYRLFLFRVVSSESGQVVYIVEGKVRNDKLWSRYPMLRDDGARCFEVPRHKQHHQDHNY